MAQYCNIIYNNNTSDDIYSPTNTPIDLTFTGQTPSYELTSSNFSVGPTGSFQMIYHGPACNMIVNFNSMNQCAINNYYTIGIAINNTLDQDMVLQSSQNPFDYNNYTLEKVYQVADSTTSPTVISIQCTSDLSSGTQLNGNFQLSAYLLQ